MNPKHISMRMDKNDGELWLTLEKYGQPVRRIKKMTGDVLMALAADIVAVNDTRMASRDIEFADGTRIRLIVEDLTDNEKEPEDGTTVRDDGTERAQATD